MDKYAAELQNQNYIAGRTGNVPEANFKDRCFGRYEKGT